MENHLVRGKIASDKCQLLDGARIISENPFFMSQATGLLSNQCHRTSTTKENKKAEKKRHHLLLMQ